MGNYYCLLYYLNNSDAEDDVFDWSRTKGMKSGYNLDVFNVEPTEYFSGLEVAWE